MTDESPIDVIEGMRVGTAPIGEPEHCDTCGDEIVVGEAVAVFFTNTPFIEEFKTPYPFRLHCGTCESDSLFWSPTGYGELLIASRLAEGKVVENAVLRDYSGTDDGYPYEPVEAFSELVTLPEAFVRREIIPAEDLIAPQDFIYYMLLNGMHPRDAIDMETGEVTASSVNQTKFFETVFMQFEEGLNGSIGTHYDVALDEDAELRRTMSLPNR